MLLGMSGFLKRDVRPLHPSRRCPQRGRERCAALSCAVGSGDRTPPRGGRPGARPDRCACDERARRWPDTSPMRRGWRSNRGLPRWRPSAPARRGRWCGSARSTGGRRSRRPMCPAGWRAKPVGRRRHRPARAAAIARRLRPRLRRPARGDPRGRHLSGQPDLPARRDAGTAIRWRSMPRSGRARRRAMAGSCSTARTGC